MTAHVPYERFGRLYETAPRLAALFTVAVQMERLALMDMLAITGNVPTQQFNRGPFQEVNRHHQADFPNIVRPVVKRSFQPTRVDMLPLALRQGFDTMVTGRPGPVNIDIPYNVFQEEDDVEVPALSHVMGQHRPGASEGDIAKVVAMMAEAMRPVMMRPRKGFDSRSVPSMRNGPSSVLACGTWASRTCQARGVKASTTCPSISSVPLGKGAATPGE